MHIAIVVPAFNIAAFLPDAIRSAMAQSYADWSMVVVDDGSTDATAAVAAGFQDERIRLIRQRNAGVSAARNAGIAAATGTATVSWPGMSSGLSRGSARPPTTCGAAGGKVVGGRAEPGHDTKQRPPHDTEQRQPHDAKHKPSSGTKPRPPDAFLFLDGDDWLAPNALTALAGALDNAPAAIASIGRFARASVDGAARIAPSPRQGDLLERLLTRNLFANGGHLLIRRAAIESAGAFRTDLSYGEDWEYWTRLAQLGEFVSVPSPAPVLFVRERLAGAYLSRATDPAAYRPAMEAIYRNPGLARRLGATRIAVLARQGEAEMAWTVGRELVRHGRWQDGRRWLSQSIRDAPTPKRLALLGLSWLRLGPFRPYRIASVTSEPSALGDFSGYRQCD